MGVTGRWGASKATAVFLLALLVSASIPATASVFDYLYGDSTATVRAPSVSLVAGNAGLPVVPSASPDSATVSASAGVRFYIAGSTPVIVPSLDGSGTGTSIGGSSGVVQQTYGACASATSCSKAFASNVVAGHIVVVSVEWSAAVSAPAVSDGQGGSVCASFTQVSGSPVTNTAEVAMWYCTASAGGAMSPTVTWTTATTAKIDIYEVKGYTASGMGCSSGTGTSTGMSTSTSVSFSGPSFLVAGWALSSAKTVTAGSGFTLSDVSNAGDGGSGEYSITGVTSPTSFPATRSSGGQGNNWAGLGCEFPPVVAASASATLTTAASSDLVYVIVGILNAGGQTVSSVSDNSSLTYAQRTAVSYGTNVRVETWYAVTASPLTSDVVTVTLSGAVGAVVIAMGVKGVNTASPFDPALSSPASSNGTGTSASASVTTLNPNDLLIGAVVAQNNPALTAGAGFAAVTTVGTPTNSIGAGAESQSVTSVQSGASVSYSLGTSQDWVMVGDAAIAGASIISADTTAAIPTSTGSFTLSAGYSAFLWSENYTNGGTLYAGSWLLDMWASRGVSTGTVTVSIFVVNSADAVVATVLSSGTSGVISKSESEVQTQLTGGGASIPVGGRALVVLTHPTGAQTVTVYWGAGQLTDFRTPTTYNYVLTVANGSSTAFTIQLATLSSMTQKLGRLTNATIWFTTATSSIQIVVTNGALAQSSGSAVTLPALGSFNIALAAYSGATPSSSTAPSTITASLLVEPSGSPVYSEYTISFVIG